MKTKAIFLVIFAVITATNVFSMGSQTEPKFFFDKKYENGKVISSTKYELEYSGLYAKKYLCKYLYDESENLVKKESFIWNPEQSEWTPMYYIKLSYSLLDNQLASSEYASWNKKENKYNDISEKVIYQTDYAGHIFSYTFLKIKNGEEQATVQWSEKKYLSM